MTIEELIEQYRRMRREQPSLLPPPRPGFFAGIPVIIRPTQPEFVMVPRSWRERLLT